MKFNTNPVRGTVDYLPTEMDMRNYAENVILNIYKSHGFLQIKTPILESLDLLTNGDSGDNQKLMFKTIKRGDKLNLSKPNLSEADIVEEGLRFDLTVPLVRFFSNNREKLPYPFKAIQIDEAFRAERPQKGRVRQFTQCDIDILGDSSCMAEVELLVAGICCYQKLGFKNLTIKINDRQILNNLILNSGFDLDKITDICVSLDKFDKIGFEGVTQELQGKDYDTNKVKELIFKIETLKGCETNEESFEKLETMGIDAKVINSLKTICTVVLQNVDEGFKIYYDPCIIRGQGYYTGTVYEVYSEGFQRAIGAGGRYDNMVEKFTGIKTPAVGFSIGFYSTVLLMIENGLGKKSERLALLYESTNTISEILSAKLKLIESGYEVSTFTFPKNFKSFQERLIQNGFAYLVKISDINKIIKL